MEILQKSQFVEIYYDEFNSLIQQKFLPETEFMYVEQFKKEMLLFADMCVKYRPNRAFIDLLDMHFPIAPEVQEWMNTEIFVQYVNIIEKIAFLMPTDMIPALSIEQVLDEEVGKIFVQAYFDDKQKALDWLLSA